MTLFHPQSTPDARTCRTTGVLVRTRRALALASVALVLALSGCSSLAGSSGPTASTSRTTSSDDETASATPDSSASNSSSESASASSSAAPATMPRNPTPQGKVPEGLDEFYTQEVDWQPCSGNEDAECATIKVPLNYADPNGDTIDLAIVAVVAGKGEKAQGSVVLNPGGPGGSGVDLVEQSVDFVTSDALRENFNIVSFDPRGVGRSTAVKCFDDTAGKDAYLAASPDLDDNAKLQQATILQTQFAKDCASLSDGILAYVDTASSARDMDVIRGILGEEKLDYIGFSYGTVLGATYAKIYPESVGQFVLDGAVDPTGDANALSRGQALGFEAVFKGYLAECIERQGSCPFPEGTSVDDAFKQVDAKLNALETKPLATGDADRPLTRALALTAIFGPLYRHEYWDLALDPTLKALLEDDGRSVLRFSDIFNTREGGKYGDNSTEAFTAINCADEQLPIDVVAMRAEATKLEKAAPNFGKYFGYNPLACAGWEVKAAPQPALTGIAGVPPMIVIGSTGDPATPYPWSPLLQKSIANSVLLTSQSWGHTAYPSASECVADAVDSFFIDETAPDNGLTCDGGGPQQSVVDPNYEAKSYGNQ
ncbi:alpha/beta fold hydrolase [Micrococcales bacterium 31B]|nr:alpha/beta fold hydrolase [Micrococcales bacterium 31B]